MLKQNHSHNIKLQQHVICEFNYQCFKMTVMLDYDICMTLQSCYSFFVDCSSRKLELVAQCVCFFIVSFLHLLLKAPVPRLGPCYRFVGLIALIAITDIQSFCSGFSLVKLNSRHLNNSNAFKFQGFFKIKNIPEPSMKYSVQYTIYELFNLTNACKVK